MASTLHDASANKCFLAVIQPTKFCNIDCSYCYLPERFSTKKLSLDTLRQISRGLFTEDLVAEGATILWHASEPLVMSIEYYRQAFEIVVEHNTGQIPIRHSFQTNATLITPEWCEFFKDYSIDLGVSIDGPQHIHDKYRLDRNGRGTFDRTMQGIRLLQKHAVHFATISVVTSPSRALADELFDFFVENDILEMGFNSEDSMGVNEAPMNSEQLMLFKEFFTQLLRRQSNSEQPTKIREFTRFSETLTLNLPPLFEKLNQPFSVLSFDVDGNISTFSPQMMDSPSLKYGNHVYGNIHSGSIRQIVNSNEFQTAWKDIQKGIDKCQSECEFFSVCGGGVPAAKVGEKGQFDVSETGFCRNSVKAPAIAVMEHIESLFHDSTHEHESDML